MMMQRKAKPTVIVHVINPEKLTRMSIKSMSITWVITDEAIGSSPFAILFPFIREMRALDVGPLPTSFHVQPAGIAMFSPFFVLEIASRQTTTRINVCICSMNFRTNNVYTSILGLMGIEGCYQGGLSREEI